MNNLKLIFRLFRNNLGKAYDHEEDPDFVTADEDEDEDTSSESSSDDDCDVDIDDDEIVTAKGKHNNMWKFKNFSATQFYV